VIGELFGHFAKRLAQGKRALKNAFGRIAPSPRLQGALYLLPIYKPRFTKPLNQVCEPAEEIGAVSVRIG
jgi:hypothetical protein